LNENTQIMKINLNKVRNQPEYVFSDGTYYLMDEYDNIVTGMQEIWMMIDIREHIVFRHGSHESVKKRYDETQEKLRGSAKTELDPETKAVSLQMCDDLIMLNVTKLPLEEINHILASSGYIKFVLEKYQITP